MTNVNRAKIEELLEIVSSREIFDTDPELYLAAGEELACRVTTINQVVKFRNKYHHPDQRALWTDEILEFLASPCE